jgi:hypothetical protein
MERAMAKAKMWYCKCGFHAKQAAFCEHLKVRGEGHERVSRLHWAWAKEAKRAKAPKVEAPRLSQGVSRTRYCKCGFKHGNELRFIEHLGLDNPVLALEDRHWPVTREDWERAQAERAKAVGDMEDRRF